MFIDNHLKLSVRTSHLSHDGQSLIMGDWYEHEKSMNHINALYSDLPEMGPSAYQKMSADKGDYITFHASEWLLDWGQTVVPYLDIQSVVPLPRVGLNGVGLIWKRRDTTGGSVALAVIPYDFSYDVPAIGIDELNDMLVTKNEEFQQSKRDRWAWLYAEQEKWFADKSCSFSLCKPSGNN